MRLKWLIFLSTTLVFLLIIATNAWHLARLNDATSTKLGEAAFQVSEATVQSLLNQTRATEQARLNRQIASILEQVGRNSRQGRPILDTIFIDTPEVAQDINLTMTDTSTSRYIALESNNQLFEIPIPRTEIENTIEQAKDNIITTSIASLGLALILLSLIATKITRPLNQICTVSGDIGAGEFGVTLAPLSRYSALEMKQLVTSINKMSEHLASLEKEKLRLQEQQRTNEISEITRGLAHSIRNPLHTILLSTSLFDDRPDAQRQIRHQVDRIDHHIRDLMNITTHESLQAEKIDLLELIKQCVASDSNDEIIKLNCSLLVQDRVARILVPEIQSTITTLINNAKEALIDNEAPLIEITLDKGDHSTWIVCVKDNGIGVSKEITNDLFSPHITDKVHGAGMGLYIAQRILRGRYNGDIRYQPNNPHGSLFTIILSDRIESSVKERNHDQNAHFSS